MPNKTAKTWFFILTTLVVLALAYLLANPKIINIYLNKKPEPRAEEKILLVFAGDIMLDRGIEYQIQKQGQNDFNFPFLKIAGQLQSADLVIANLESQISDQGQNQGSIYSFRANPKAIEGLKYANVSVVSLANNHAFDYGSLALKDSLGRLLDNGIAPLGAGNESQAYSPTIKTVKGAKIAFFAYTDQLPASLKAKKDNLGVAIINQDNLARIKQDIGLAKKLADLVVISLHWGVEYAVEPNASQTILAKELIDAGADLVIGHHPHVVQKYEKYRGKYIFYSLGNFVFDQGFSQETLAGELVQVIIKNKKIEQVIPIRIKINEFFQPELKNDSLLMTIDIDQNKSYNILTQNIIN